MRNLKTECGGRDFTAVPEGNGWLNRQIKNVKINQTDDGSDNFFGSE